MLRPNKPNNVDNTKSTSHQKMTAERTLSIHDIINQPDDALLTYRLAHFSNSTGFTWDKGRKYRGEERPPYTKWYTFKPQGIYLAHENEYHKWRYDYKLEFENMRNLQRTGKQLSVEQARRHLIQRIRDDIDQANWFYKAYVDVQLRKSDVLIVTSNDDLPETKDDIHGMWRWLNSIIAQGGQPTPKDWEYAIKRNKLRKQWKKIQKQYKAMYFHPDYFQGMVDFDEDNFLMHHSNLILFDASCILQDNYEPELFSLIDWAHNTYNIFTQEDIDNEVPHRLHAQLLAAHERNLS